MRLVKAERSYWKLKPSGLHVFQLEVEISGERYWTRKACSDEEVGNFSIDAMFKAVFQESILSRQPFGRYWVIL